MIEKLLGLSPLLQSLNSSLHARLHPFNRFSQNANLSFRFDIHGCFQFSHTDLISHFCKTKNGLDHRPGVVIDDGEDNKKGDRNDDLENPDFIFIIA